MTENRDALLGLLEPFPPEHVGKLPRVICTKCSDRRQNCDEHRKQRCEECNAYISTRHIHLDYVGHADVTRRLLETDPAWQWEPAATDENGLPLVDTDAKDNPVGMWIRLTVLGVTRLGYGSCPSGQNDAVKVLIGDALRNAAMRFGVALDLWAKGDRADPAEQNAVAAGGQAARRRPQQQAPEQRTDHDWLQNIEGRIQVAANRGELTKLAREISAQQKAGKCEQVHADHLWELGKQRQDKLGIHTNQDGSLSRSRMSDEALAREGAMTTEQQKEHNALRRSGGPKAEHIERGPIPPDEDPWATGGFMHDQQAEAGQ